MINQVFSIPVVKKAQTSCKESEELVVKKAQTSCKKSQELVVKKAQTINKNNNKNKEIIIINIL